WPRATSSSPPAPTRGTRSWPNSAATASSRTTTPARTSSSRSERAPLQPVLPLEGPVTDDRDGCHHPQRGRVAELPAELGHAPEEQQLAPHVEELLLDGRLVGHVLVVEDAVLELLELVLGGVGGVEVPVDELVEQYVDQEARRAPLRPRTLEPGLRRVARPDVARRIRLAHRDHPVGADEEVDLLQP